MVTERHTVVIYRNLSTLTGGGASWSENLYLPFKPDQICIRNIDYSNGANTKDSHIVVCPFIDSRDNILCSFLDIDSYSSGPNTIYRIKDTTSLMNGEQSFQVFKILNNTTTATATGVLSITLEFSKSTERRDPYEALQEISKQFGGLYELYSMAQVHQTTIKKPEDYIPQVPPVVVKQDGSGNIVSQINQQEEEQAQE